MSNFAFIGAAEWPDIQSDCARAESYLASDPRSACIYGRRAIEQLVGLLYDVMDLPLPYKDDLAARINEREQLSIPVDRGVSGDLRFGVLIAV